MGEELEQLELLEREVERAAADLRRVGRLVDDDLAGADDVGLGVVRTAGSIQPTDRELDPRLELRRTTRVQDDVVHPPVVLHDGESAFGADEEQGSVTPRG